MSKVRGILEKSYRNGRGFYSIMVNDTWYGTYKTDHTDKEGMEVEFEATKKGNFWNAGEVSVLGGNEAPPPAKATRAAGNTPAAEARQQSIVLQSSYKVAADLLHGLIVADKVTLGAKGKAYDNAVGMLDDLTLRIYNNCIDPAPFLEGRGMVEATNVEDDYNPMEA